MTLVAGYADAARGWGVAVGDGSAWRLRSANPLTVDRLPGVHRKLLAIGGGWLLSSGPYPIAETVARRLTHASGDPDELGPALASAAGDVRRIMSRYPRDLAAFFEKSAELIAVGCAPDGTAWLSGLNWATGEVWDYTGGLMVVAPPGVDPPSLMPLMRDAETALHRCVTPTDAVSIIAALFGEIRTRWPDAPAADVVDVGIIDHGRRSRLPCEVTV